MGHGHDEIQNKFEWENERHVQGRAAGKRYEQQWKKKTFFSA
jgi:hypothetical protein